MVVMKFHRILEMVIALSAIALARAAEPILIAPLYIEYTSSSAGEFAKEVKDLKQSIGQAPGVLVGFSAFLNVRFTGASLNKPIDRSVMQPTLDDIDLIVERARQNDLPVHISIHSGFFHSPNTLREAAIRTDVRNAQWFSDGWIAIPEEIGSRNTLPRSAWATPSRYAQPLRQQMEESTRLIGEHLTAAMKRFPETLHSISGDTEVEFSYERNLDAGERPRANGQLFYADYSPFMVAEFRDWLRKARYAGDLSPASDDDHDGHTFNQDYRQGFRTWRLRYFDESGPIPFDQYRAMPQKLPQSGRYFIDGGFDAPRIAGAATPLWQAWKEFRVRVVVNYAHDFAEWITAGSRIPASRFYTHQIPAEYLFEGKDTLRLETSASPLETAFIQPFGSSGVTVFDTFDGKNHTKTSNPGMFRRLEQSGTHWGILEYNPSVPAAADENYYLTELRALYSFHPSVIAPFAWTNEALHKKYRIQDTAYERALKKFIQEIRSR